MRSLNSVSISVLHFFSPSMNAMDIVRLEVLWLQLLESRWYEATTWSSFSICHPFYPIDLWSAGRYPNGTIYAVGEVNFY